MARTIGFLIYVVVHIGFTAAAYIPFLVIRTLTRSRLSYAYLTWFSRVWSRILLRFAGARVTVLGLDLLPAHNRICLISNHQSFADIPLLQGYIDRPLGFLAKAELQRVPLLSRWMRAYNCVFIRRGKIRGARRTIERAAAVIRSGTPLLVFPEGVRNKGGPMRRFKSGSLRIAYLAEATIVPVTLDGVAGLLEERGYVHAAKVTLPVHPPLEPSEYAALPSTQLADQLQKQIGSALSGGGLVRDR